MNEYQVSRSHAAMFAQVARHDREEQQVAEARAEAFAYRCAAMAEDVREQQAIAFAAEMARAVRLEQVEHQRREEAQARAEDDRARLLQSGAGRWRTVQEILDAAAGRL